MGGPGFTNFTNCDGEMRKNEIQRGELYCKYKKQSNCLENLKRQKQNHSRWCEYNLCLEVANSEFYKGKISCNENKLEEQKKCYNDMLRTRRINYDRCECDKYKLEHNNTFNPEFLQGFEKCKKIDEISKKIAKINPASAVARVCDDKLEDVPLAYETYNNITYLYVEVSGYECGNGFGIHKKQQGYKVNGIYTYEGLTNGGQPYYKNTETNAHLFYDANCGCGTETWRSSWFIGCQAPLLNRSDWLQGGKELSCCNSINFGDTFPNGTQEAWRWCGNSDSSGSQNITVTPGPLQRLATVPLQRLATVEY